MKRMLAVAISTSFILGMTGPSVAQTGAGTPPGNIEKPVAKPVPKPPTTHPVDKASPNLLRGSAPEGTTTGTPAAPKTVDPKAATERKAGAKPLDYLKTGDPKAGPSKSTPSAPRQ